MMRMHTYASNVSSGALEQVEATAIIPSFEGLLDRYSCLIRNVSRVRRSQGKEFGLQSLPTETLPWHGGGTGNAMQYQTVCADVIDSLAVRC